MKTKQLFWTIFTFGEEVNYMTCDAVRVAKEAMAIADFNKATAELNNGTVLTLDKGQGNYFVLYAKYPNLVEKEVARILEPKAQWIDVNPMAQTSMRLGAKYLVINWDDEEWYYGSQNIAEHAFDTEGIKFYLLLDEEYGRVKVIEIESESLD